MRSNFFSRENRFSLNFSPLSMFILCQARRIITLMCSDHNKLFEIAPDVYKYWFLEFERYVEKEEDE